MATTLRPTDRIDLWHRGNGYGLRLRRATLRDFATNGPPAAGDVTVTAQVCELAADDGAEPTPIVGAATLILSYDAVQDAWLGVAPYTAGLYGARPAVRVVVTATTATGALRLMDATVRFARADGR